MQSSLSCSSFTLYLSIKSILSLILYNPHLLNFLLLSCSILTLIHLMPLIPPSQAPFNPPFSCPVLWRSITPHIMPLFTPSSPSPPTIAPARILHSGAPQHNSLSAFMRSFTVAITIHILSSSQHPTNTLTASQTHKEPNKYT